MTQAIVGPARKASLFTNPIKLFTRAHRRETAFHPGVRTKPCGKVRLHGDNPASRAFRFCRLHFDMPARQVDLAPLQTFDFSVTKPRERAEREHWKHVRANSVCGLQDPAQFVNYEDFRRDVDQLWLCGV